MSQNYRHYRKLFLSIIVAFLFLAVVCSVFVGNQKTYAAPADSNSDLTVTVQPYPTPYTVYEVGQAYSQQIATGTDDLGPGDPISYTIDWGDGTTPTQQTFIDGRAFSIMGAHAYSKVGTYTVTVTVAIDAFQESATATGTINVVPDYTLNVNTIKSTVGQAFTGIVAIGTDPFPNDPLNGTINWGDNTTPTSVSVESLTDGSFQLNATHTYSQTGTWTITVALTSIIVGPISATGTATTTVLPPSLFTLTPHHIIVWAHHKSHSTVATVGGTISSAGLNVTINWGDGTTTSQNLKGGKGTFSVQGSHTYKKVGRYTITIVAEDKGTGQTVTVTSTATVL